MKYRNPIIFKESFFPLVNLKKYKSVVIRDGDANTTFLKIGLHPFNSGRESAPSKSVY